MPVNKSESFRHRMPKFIQTKIIKRQSKSLSSLSKQKTVICTKMLWIQRYFSERITYMKLLKTGLKYFEVCFLNLIKTQMSLDKGSKSVKLKKTYKNHFSWKCVFEIIIILKYEIGDVIYECKNYLNLFWFLFI